MRLIFFVVTGPFWVQLIAAAALAWLGLHTHQETAARRAALAELALAQPPAPRAIQTYRIPDPRPEVEEVRFVAQIALEHSTRIVRKTHFITTGESFLVLLFAPGDGPGTRVVQGAMLLDAAQAEQFPAWGAANTKSLGQLGPVVEIGGLRRRPAHAGNAATVMSERGLTTADNFSYVEPFFDGRPAGFAAAARPSLTDLVPFALAALFVLIAAAKVLRPRRRSAGPAPSASSSSATPHVATARATPAATAVDTAFTTPAVTPTGRAPYDPIANLSRGKPIAQGSAAPAIAKARNGAAGDAGPIRTGDGARAGLPVFRLLVAGVGVVLLAVTGTGMLTGDATSDATGTSMAGASPPTAAPDPAAMSQSPATAQDAGAALAAPGPAPAAPAAAPSQGDRVVLVTMPGHPLPPVSLAYGTPDVDPALPFAPVAEAPRAPATPPAVQASGQSSPRTPAVPISAAPKPVAPEPVAAVPAAAAAADPVVVAPQPAVVAQPAVAPQPAVALPSPPAATETAAAPVAPAASALPAPEPSAAPTAAAVPAGSPTEPHPAAVPVSRPATTDQVAAAVPAPDAAATAADSPASDTAASDTAVSDTAASDTGSNGALTALAILAGVLTAGVAALRLSRNVPGLVGLAPALSTLTARKPGAGKLAEDPFDRLLRRMEAERNASRPQRA